MTFFGYLTNKAADAEKNDCGSMRCEEDMFLNGAQSGLQQIGEPRCVFSASDFYPKWSMHQASDKLMKSLKTFTGWQNIPRPDDAP